VPADQHVARRASSAAREHVHGVTWGVAVADQFKGVTCAGSGTDGRCVFARDCEHREFRTRLGAAVQLAIAGVDNHQADRSGRTGRLVLVSERQRAPVGHGDFAAQVLPRESRGISDADENRRR